MLISFTLVSQPLLPQENFKDCVFLKNRNSQLKGSPDSLETNANCVLHLK